MIRDIFSKTIQCFQREGFVATLKKSIRFIGFKVQKKRNDRVCADVLFVNGSYLKHPARYRVNHQMEQLEAQNISCSEVFYTELSKDMVSNYRLFVFFRCAYTEGIKEFIDKARKYNKAVIYDIDDMVFDRIYVEGIPYLSNLSDMEREEYYESVDGCRKMLDLCDAAVVSTEGIAKEMSRYVPEVYVNRNMISEQMASLSEIAWCQAGKERCRKIILGYFSGSNSHADDLRIIINPLIKILETYKDVVLLLSGEIAVPDSLKNYGKRIKYRKFVDWKRLPELIAGVDINLAPLENSIFNQGKSENKWTEAAMVRRATVASKVGGFAESIVHGETGMLCASEDEWFESLVALIESKELREKIAANAYDHVTKHYMCVSRDDGYARFLCTHMKKNILMVLPTVKISGGSLVAIRHCTFLQEAGYDVTVLIEEISFEREVKMSGRVIPVLNKDRYDLRASYDLAVGTLWSTVDFVTTYPKIDERRYLVQGYESDLVKHGDARRLAAERTYGYTHNIQYITVSKWCQKWLFEKYHKKAHYAPNGIDLTIFWPQKRKLIPPVRILIEGDCSDENKNVDESFAITNKLDREKFEIWYMSYHGSPKSTYMIDRYICDIPNEQTAEIYRSCDILIKSSVLESFSYPPLEMMATGGYVIARSNDGNKEYLSDGYNCLLYDADKLETGKICIEKIVYDRNLQNILYENGLKTARVRDWRLVKKEIIGLYE